MRRTTNNDDSLLPVETVHLRQELVQSLLVERLILRAPLASNRIQLVNKDDRRPLLPRRREELPDPPRSDSDVHLVELGSGGREERHSGLARYGTSEEGLARSGRTGKEYAARETTSELLIPGRVLQEVNDLEQFVLGFFHAVDVFKGRAAAVGVGRVGRGGCLEVGRLGAGAKDAGRVDKEGEEGEAVGGRDECQGSQVEVGRAGRREETMKGNRGMGKKGGQRKTHSKNEYNAVVATNLSIRHASGLFASSTITLIGSPATPTLLPLELAQLPKLPTLCTFASPPFPRPESPPKSPLMSAGGENAGAPVLAAASPSAATTIGSSFFSSSLRPLAVCSFSNSSAVARSFPPDPATVARAFK